jgi:hypothetical protein
MYTMTDAWCCAVSDKLLIFGEDEYNPYLPDVKPTFLSDLVL